MEYHHTFEDLLREGGSTSRKIRRQTQYIRISEPHSTRKELMKAILTILFEDLNDELSATLTDADWETTRADGKPRWKKNAGITIYQHLKPAGLIEAKTKNQWVITEKGKKYLVDTHQN